MLFHFLPGQDFDRRFILSFAGVKWAMIMVEHDQVEHLLSNLSPAGIEVRSDKGVDHLN